MTANVLNHFSIDLFNHPHRLDRFMSGEEDLKHILRVAKDPTLVKRPTKDSLYFGRWQVAWIYVKSPFELIFAIFTHAIAALTGIIGATRLSHYFTLLSHYLSLDVEHLAHQWRFNENLLVPSVNNLKLGAWDIYRYGNIPIEQIKNENLLKYTFFRDFCDGIVNQLLNHIDQPETKEAFFKLMLARKQEEAIQLLIEKFPHQDTEKVVRDSIEKLFSKTTLPLLNKVEFFRPHKLCKGSTLWFIHLFMKSSGYFQDVEKHAMAVADVFKKGVPSQGILLQALSDETNLLHRNAPELKEYSVPQNASTDDALEKVQSLPPGLYKVNVYHHAFAYIKTGGEKDYVFNPNFGLLHLDAKAMLDMVYAYHYKKDDPSPILSFNQYHAFERNRETAAG